MSPPPTTFSVCVAVGMVRGLTGVEPLPRREVGGNPGEMREGCGRQTSLNPSAGLPSKGEDGSLSRSATCGVRGGVLSANVIDLFLRLGEPAAVSTLLLIPFPSTRRGDGLA